jgi:copper chaperone CopZ
MDKTPPDASKNAALHEYIDAKAAIDGLETPGQEKTLRSALEHLPGVQWVSITSGEAAVRYEPVRITKAQLIQAIQDAGFGVAEFESAPASPLTDAFVGKAEVAADRGVSRAQQKTSS